MNERSHSLHGALRKARQLHPRRTAIVDGEREVDYAELDRISDSLASALVQAGVREGDRVGVDLPKSWETVAGIYGILKAGAAYVPLDPSSPLERSSEIVRDCGVRCMLVGSPESPWIREPATDTGLRTVVIVSGDPEAPDLSRGPNVVTGWRHRPPDPPTRDVGGSDLAYVLYTSGTTGTPKGVPMTHGNALAFVDWAVREFGLTYQDRLSSHAPLHFDLSVFDLFAAATAGAALLLIPPHVAALPAEQSAWLEDSKVTVWYSVPSALDAMVRRGGLERRDVENLRWVLFAGEVFPTPRLRELMELLPQARFANLFGPTETNVCTWYEVTELPEDDAETIPIGWPIPGTRAFPLDDGGREAEPGEIGELVVRGPAVMSGYWGEEPGGASFVQLSEGPMAGVVYRTGDLVRVDERGLLRYVGRNDFRIKVRGLRIDLMEVEAVLSTNPDVADVAVIAVPDVDAGHRLIACVVARGAQDAKSFLRTGTRRLPRYMCPDRVEFHDALPRTSTGKIDRAALAQHLSGTGGMKGPGQGPERRQRDERS
jgi:amino acid adenylation domain-containing protein